MAVNDTQLTPLLFLERAGDVFAAGLVHALLAGQPMSQALATAVDWGAAAAACRGLPARQTIQALLQGANE